jgi:hypothetical protein
MYSEKTCPSATLSTTNPTLYDLGSNPSRCCGNPATNRLIYRTALENKLVDIFNTVFRAYFSKHLFCLLNMSTRKPCPKNYWLREPGVVPRHWVDKISWSANRCPLVDEFPQNFVLLCFFWKVVLEIVKSGFSKLIKVGIRWRTFFYLYDSLYFIFSNHEYLLD